MLDKDKEKTVTEKYLSALTKYFTGDEKNSLNQVYRGKLTREEFLHRARQYLQSIIYQEEAYLADKIMEMFEINVWGYGKIQPLLDAMDISDIKIFRDGAGGIRITENGVRKTSDITFDSYEEYLAFYQMIATKNSAGTSLAQSSISFVDTKSSDLFRLRITMTLGYITDSEKPIVTIRKFPKFKRSPDEMVKSGFLTQEQYDYLAEEIRNGESLNICGRGGTYKSTLVNTLLEEVPEQDAIEIIQENQELFVLKHPECINLHIVNNTGDGKISYSLETEAKMGLLQDIDTFVIGEVKGEEAMDLISCNYTGTRTINTVHCYSAEAFADRMVILAMKGAPNLKREDLLRMMVNMGIIVFIEKENGVRRVKDIAKIRGYDEKAVKLILEYINFDGKEVRRG